MSIEDFYQEKVKQAKEAVIEFKAQGIEVCYEDLLDAKSIWYEYCSTVTEDMDDEVYEYMEKHYGPGYLETFLSQIDKTTGW